MCFLMKKEHKSRSTGKQIFRLLKIKQHPKCSYELETTSVMASFTRPACDQSETFWQVQLLVWEITWFGCLQFNRSFKRRFILLSEFRAQWNKSMIEKVNNFFKWLHFYESSSIDKNKHVLLNAGTWARPDFVIATVCFLFFLKNGCCRCWLHLFFV